jgi:NAD(P)-dependent dehydrogenase (short-subunit alcohol dehydrogenase family)
MRDGGVIINMSSIASLVGGIPVVAYGTTKGAVNSLTKTMAVQHGPDGIRVNAIAPGYVYTPMVTATGMTDEAREKRRRAAPLGTEGTAWDVAQAVVYLASDQARWISGTILPVDAGLTADGMGMSAERARDS